MPRIPIVEDGPAVRYAVEHALSREGMGTLAVGSGEAALERLRESEEGTFGLVGLDVMPPGMDGISVCREIREAGKNGDVPVAMLTARDDMIQVVVGLEVGADDYVTKPFSPRELVSRVRAHLRRRRLDARSVASASSSPEKKLEFPGLEIDLLRRRVMANGEEVSLTAREFDVLTLLASHPGRVYGREQIMRHLWGATFSERRAADVHIQHIRHKVEPDPKNPRYVQTVRGAGYRFAEF